MQKKEKEETVLHRETTERLLIIGLERWRQEGCVYLCVCVRVCVRVCVCVGR